MPTMRQVVCAICGTVHTKTVKQVNQAIKRKGRWACVSCMQGHNRRDLIGERFGRLTVLERASDFVYASSSKVAWHCKCDCGQVTTTLGSSLTTGHTKSCGCLLKETRGNNTKTHGMSSTREARIWMAMRTRCQNKNVPNYANYGGRGIKVCERWESFENFYADMGECPAGYSIERLDTNGNYEPSNCVWADRETQARNTRRNRKLTLNGVTKCLKEWADDLAIDQASLRERLDKWTLEEALTKPKKG